MGDYFPSYFLGAQPLNHLSCFPNVCTFGRPRLRHTISSCLTLSSLKGWWESLLSLSVNFLIPVCLSAKSLSCDSMDCSPLGSSVHGILQARILECIAISFSRGIFPTQGQNPHLLHLLCLLHWQADSLPLSKLESLCGDIHPQRV